MPPGGMDMEAVILIGGVVFAIVAGYFAIDRLDRFLSEVGITPDGDEEEKGAAGQKKGAPTEAGVCKKQDYCDTSGRNVL